MAAEPPQRAKIRSVLFSTLYPSGERPGHGIFVETRLRELLKTGEVDARVVAPVPWFPLRGERFGTYAQFARTPALEIHNGIEVHHPRYFLPPRIGMVPAPFLLALGALPLLRRLRREGFSFDLIDAHYYYPDGVAAAMLSRWLGVPCLITARGSDLNLIAEFGLPRRMILRAARQASASIGVSAGLMARLAAIGAAPDKLHVLRNGVDLEKFAPHPRELARRRLGLPVEGRLLLSVGNLLELKGHHFVIEALRQLPPEVHVAIVGRGDQRPLEQVARDCGVLGRLKLVGGVPQTELSWWYSAADALALCSSREGWPNVLLESMACGTPVLATDIDGIREVVSDPAAGILMDERSAGGVARAWERLMTNPPGREATRRFAEGFSWEDTSAGQLRLFRQAIEGR